MSEEVATSILYFGAEAIEAIGIVQSINDNNSAEVAEAKDENGKTIEEKAYSKNRECTIEALIKVGVTPPDAGALLTVAGVQYLVRSANKTKSNSEYNKVSITASKKDAAALIPYTA